MKLLELIVKSVKRESICPYATLFIQEWVCGEYKIVELDEEPCRALDNSCWYYCGAHIHLNLPSDIYAEDASTTFITREELMRAYDLVEQGYTLWFGGPCPLKAEDDVQVVWRDGACVLNNSKAENYSWNHLCLYDDIIAYKLVEEPLSPTPLGEDFFDDKLSLPTYYCEEKLQDTTLDVWTSQSGDLCVNLTSLGVNNEIMMSPITALQFANDLSFLALKIMEKGND